MAAVLRSRVPTMVLSTSPRRLMNSETSQLLLNSLSQIASSKKNCISRFSRLLAAGTDWCGASMQPLHSATASARLNSELAAEPRCWSLVPQGLSMPL